jgi:ABC-type lipoprotein release transport system permease subunit
VLAALLFGVSPTDAVTLAGAAVGLLLVAALASFIPARAGARVDPIVVLRTE